MQEGQRRGAELAPVRVQLTASHFVLEYADSTVDIAGLVDKIRKVTVALAPLTPVSPTGPMPWMRPSVRRMMEHKGRQVVQCVVTARPLAKGV